jgi:hypothetical protein
MVMVGLDIDICDVATNCLVMTFKALAHKTNDSK